MSDDSAQTPPHPHDNSESSPQETTVSETEPIESREEQGNEQAKPSMWRLALRIPHALGRRLSLRLIVFRMAAYGILLVSLLLAAGYLAITLLVKPDDLSRVIKRSVEEQTGGRIDIARVHFDALRGLRLESVQFYPPATGDTRGFLRGGEINPVPLANFDALDVQYSIPKALAGRIQIRALQLVEPQIHLKQIDGVWNFDSIIAFRAEHFPSGSTAPSLEEPTEQAPATANADLVSYAPSLLYMPFEILAQNIGITNLSLDLIKEEDGKVAQILLTNGLSFDLGAHWHGSNSRFWFSSLNPFERPLELEIRDAQRDPQGQITSRLGQTLLVKSALSTRFELTDFKKVSFDFATRVIQLNTPAAGFENLGAFAKIRLLAADDYKSIKIDTINVDAANALTYDLQGTLSWRDLNFEAITVKLAQNFRLDLQRAAVLSKPFVPSLAASGEINSDGLEIEGTINLKNPDEDTSFALPHVWGVIWIEDAFVSYPETGISMQPVSGDIQLSAGPTMNSQGSQFDIDVDLLVPSLIATQKIGEGLMSAGVDDLNLKLTTRALWPQMTAPIFKLNVEAAHVRAFGHGPLKNKIPAIDTPLYIDIAAEGGQDLDRLSLNMQAELSGLAEFSVMADCQIRCTRFRSNAMVRLDSLQNLHAIALPLTGMFGASDLAPTELSGSLDTQFAARGRLPDPFVTPVAEILQEGDIHFSTQMNLSRINTTLPSFKLKLKGFESRLGASGTLKQQKLDLTQKLETLSLELPPGTESPPGTKPQGIEVTRLSFDTNLANDIDGLINVENPLSQLASSLMTRLYIGKISLDGALPRPISDIQITVEADQAKLANFTLKDLTIKLPDLGSELVLQAQTKLGADFLPQSIQTKLRTSIAHTGDEKLPFGIKTSGEMDLHLELASSDMKTLAMDGEATFENFDITIPSLDEPSHAPLLLVEGVKGQIPFKQKIPLPNLQAMKDGKSLAEATTLVPLASPSKLEESDKNQASDEDLRRKALDQAVTNYFEKNDDKIMKSANVAAMVDYATVRPFYPERRPLSINRLDVANLELSKMEFDIELRQNWFSLNQYVINFLGGKIQGDLRLAFDPMPRSLSTSIHMTKLDTRKLLERFPNLKGKQSSWGVFSNPYLDGTVHLKYDMKNNDMSGGVEITSIGKEQLKAMLYYVDPFEQNPTISDIRTALNFGEVRQVSIPLKNGEIDLDVDVRVLGAPLPTPKLSRFPISQILQNFKDQSSKDTTPKGPDSLDAAPTIEGSTSAASPSPIAPEASKGI